jgi:inosine-uridine nucleoside N-ribohydrolase
MKNVLIDCDPGIDDSIALLFALNHPELEIRAITTVSGNLLADACSLNARRILHLCNSPKARNIPIARGPLKPLVRQYPRDPFFHGFDGLGDLGIVDTGGLEENGQFAADLIIDTVNRYKDVTSESGSKGLTILCLGPMTNLALAIMKDSTLPIKVAEVLFIGGSFGFNSVGTVRATGDNPVSEWNVYVDPEAASLVFNAGFNLTALGLDVVTLPSIELSPSHRQTLHKVASKSPAAKLLLNLLSFAESRQFASWCCLIDSVAVAVAIDHSIVEVEEIKVAVETQSNLSLGQTIVDRRERMDFQWTQLPKIKAARDIDANKFLESLVGTLVVGHTKE